MQNNALKNAKRTLIALLDLILIDFRLFFTLEKQKCVKDRKYFFPEGLFRCFWYIFNTQNNPKNNPKKDLH